MKMLGIISVMTTIRMQVLIAFLACSYLSSLSLLDVAYSFEGGRPPFFLLGGRRLLLLLFLLLPLFLLLLLIIAI